MKYVPRVSLKFDWEPHPQFVASSRQLLEIIQTLGTLSASFHWSVWIGEYMGEGHPAFAPNSNGAWVGDTSAIEAELRRTDRGQYIWAIFRAYLNRPPCGLPVPAPEFEGPPREDLEGALLEIWVFDSSYVEVASNQPACLKHLSSRYRVPILDGSSGI